MISYCSEEHRLWHQPQHREICDVIRNINYNIWDSRNMMRDKWIKFKEKNVRRIKQELRRELEPYEEQMFLYPKSCLICYHQINLPIDCRYCCSSTCCVHTLDNQAHKCKERAKCFNLDKQYAIKNKGDQKISIKFLCLEMDIRAVPNMALFVGMCIQRDKQHRNWTLDDYAYTDVFSKPLTLFYGMRQISSPNHFDMSGTFIVHIITGGSMDIRNLSAWEILLHQQKMSTILTIVMIGPELQDKQDTLKTCGLQSFRKV
ncbi:hypothetical protein EAI_10366 [Harpegnathos saltator]|uniref:Mitochondrial splicing suppressor 51-like C-terminal domain-containing protein n=1 Tax=Harpegnathos saltator TaxID=610380 RepID=E2B5Q7_HARSA|nr:hypothetical protein EAI_10366 [Harpegnathos saltator]